MKFLVCVKSLEDGDSVWSSVKAKNPKHAAIVREAQSMLKYDDDYTRKPEKALKDSIDYFKKVSTRHYPGVTSFQPGSAATVYFVGKNKDKIRAAVHKFMEQW